MALFENDTVQVTALQEHNAKLQAMVEQLQDKITNNSVAMANHQNCEYWRNEQKRITSQLVSLVDNSYADELSSNEILTSICEIIDYSPTKTVEFTATISFSGTIDIPMSEAEDFDLTDILGDAYVDINNGNVVINEYELYDANEC